MLNKCLHYVVVAALVLASDPISAESNQAELLLRTGHDFWAPGEVSTEASRKRLLRAFHEGEDELASQLAENEERVKIPDLNKVANELKAGKEKQKMLAVALTKTKVKPNGQTLNRVTKKIQEKPPAPPAKMDNVEAQLFARIFRNNKGMTPEKARKVGLFRNKEQLARYEDFYKALATKAKH
ncbi:hypothetical protein GN244_ATG15074 [Phytophthora infestans]|uniref:RxLR effector protein n=2 Tax=Phytophthora infestans TaxID=4787 RepID=A0A833SW85_PHYIN|nr:hypothetical protein GN244_ATG15074 [Phytophthora infestans]KAF4129709.1 hypothetical protein GN958_ATG21204 [Phytophthora infestans]